MKETAGIKQGSNGRRTGGWPRIRHARASAAARLFLAVVLALGMGLPVPVALVNPGDADDATVLDAAWQAGEVVIDQPGRYTVSANLDVAHPLVVKLAAGQQATLDLAGHTINVAGSQAFAVDATQNAGSFTVTDSAYSPDAAAADKADRLARAPRAGIVKKVAGDKAGGIAGVLDVTRAFSTREAQPSVSLENVFVRVEFAPANPEAFTRDVAAVRTGAAFWVDANTGKAAETREDAGQNPRTPASQVSLRNVSVEAKVSADVAPEALDEADVAPDAQGKAYAVCANTTGVLLDGFVQLKAEGTPQARQLECALVASVQLGANLFIADSLEVRAATADSPQGDALEVARFDTKAAPAQDELDRLKAPDGYTLDVSKEAGVVKLEAAPAQQAQDAAGTLEAQGDAAPTATAEQDEAPQETPDAASQGGADAASKAAPEATDQALAAPQDETLAGAQVEATAAQAASRTNLNAAWKKAGLDSTFTITQGGTYYLSADLSATNGILVNAPGEDVTIAFEGHTLKASGFGGSTKQTIVRVDKAASVTLDGTASQGVSKLVGAGAADLYYVSLEADGCAATVKNLTIDQATDSVQLNTLGTHAVRALRGSLAVENCTIKMNFGNQTMYGATSVSATEAPSAVYAAPAVTRLSLSNCTVSAVGSPVVAGSLDADLAGPSNVYALYSQAASTTVAGGSYSATSALGSAAAILATNARIASSVQLAADGHVVSAGIVSTQAGGIELAAPVSYSTEGTYADASTVSAALRATVANGFAFAAAGTPSGTATLPVFVRLADSGANGAGVRIGTFKDVSASQRTAWAAALANALGGDAACTVASDAAGAFFQLQQAKAAARIGSTYYATVEAALAAFTAGDTLQLLVDAGHVEVAKVASGTIDLNGHALSTLSYTAPAAVGEAGSSGLVVKNGRIEGLKSSGSGWTSVLHGSAFPLALQDIDVSFQAANTNNASGVFASNAATGALTLANVNIDGTLARTGAPTSGFGVRMHDSSSAPLVIANSNIRLATGSSGIALQGVYAPKGVGMSGGSIVVRNATGSSAGAQVAADSRFENVEIDVHTSAKASTAYGIWCSAATANPAVQVGVDGCAVSVTSATDVGEGPYWCLRAGSSATQNSTVRWMLGGASSFESASTTHIGSNAAQVAVQPNFSLAAVSQSPVRISQQLLEGHVGFASTNGSSIAAQAGLFAPAAGSAYEGWQLKAHPSNNAQLVWAQPGAAGTGAVALVRNGTQVGTFDTLAAALVQAQSDDALVLLADVSEPAPVSIDVDNLSLDVAGRTAVVHANAAAASTQSVGAGIRYAGGPGSTFAVRDSAGGGTLRIEVGAAVETAKDVTYQGMAASSGTIAIGRGAVVQVAYTGSSATQVQRPVTVVGASAAGGSLDVRGTLEVVSAREPDVIGAQAAYGILADAAQGQASRVSVASTGQVRVVGQTAASRNDTGLYPGTAQSGTTSYYVREITVDEQQDAEFYDAIQEQFKISATLDPKQNYTAASQYGTGIYYTSGYMTLSAPGKWFDGLKMWAYSDVVPDSDVGKLASIKAAHIYILEPCDTLPEVAGIASAAGSAGTVDVQVQGTVQARNAYGGAVALQAQGGASTTWACLGATVAVQADQTVHSVLDKSLDLRDVITFDTKQDKPVVYRGGWGASPQLGRFTSPVAVGARVADGVSFTLDGAYSSAVQGLDPADLEASTVHVGASFSPASTLSVAHKSGANTAGDTFAVPTGSATLDATDFKDAYAALASARTQAGALAWGTQANTVTATFKVGDAVVARYANPGTVDLSEPSARAARTSDALNNHVLAGWSTHADDCAPAQYKPDQSVAVSTSTTYHAAFNDQRRDGVLVEFANVHEADGSLADTLRCTTTYGHTVSQVLDANGAQLPTPADYTDAATNTTYRFAGWYVRTLTDDVASRLYPSDTIGDALVINTDTGTLADRTVQLWASYIPVKEGQHLVTFKVDNYVYACAVDDGARPFYHNSDLSATVYDVPSKQDTQTGVTFEFKEWQAQADGATYPVVLPAAHEDVTYVAQFDSKPAAVKLSFYYLRPSIDQSSTYSQQVYVVDTTYKVPVQESADKLVKIGDKVAFGGKVHTFAGWALRSTDVEPYYTASNPIPSGNWDERIIETLPYSTTYYAVYDVTDHLVDVAFVAQGSEVGTAQVLATATVGDAFGKTGQPAPADNAQAEVFRGWATTQDATEELAGSTLVSSLVEGAADTLTLYAVYGNTRSYSVKFYGSDRVKLLYDVSVKHGSTTGSVLVANNAQIDNPPAEGKYFKSWQRLTGQPFGLDTVITGATSAFPVYGDVAVQSRDSSDIDATVACTVSGLDGTDGVQLRLTPMQSADYPIRNFTAENGYTLLKSYDMRLVATQDGQERELQGKVGTITVKVAIPEAYKASTMRAFWLSGTGAVVYSPALKVGDDGFATFDVSDYQIGDIMEGGNLSIGYIEGSGSKIDDTGDGPEAKPTSQNGQPAQTGQTTQTAGTPRTPTVINPPLQSAGPALSATAARTSAVAADPALAAAARTAAVASAPAAAAANASGALAKDAAEMVASAHAAQADEFSAQLDEAQSSWSADSVVFLLLCLLALAALCWGAWRFFIVGKRFKDDDEDDVAELPDTSPATIRF